MKKFDNKFGSLTLTPVTALLRVKDISAAKCPEANANAFDMATVEKIALITENHRVQVCVPYPLNNDRDKVAYVVLHDTPSTAWICRVDIHEFATEGNISPAQQIASMTNYIKI